MTSRPAIWLVLALSFGGSFPDARPAGAAPLPAPAPGSLAPPVPPLKSPVDLFRELLTLPRVEREHYLAGRAPAIRARLSAKIQEYEALKPEDRELRLRMTQLRWLLLPLLQTPGTNREAQLAAIPAADRGLVADRLRQWDILPPDLKTEVLEYESPMRYFVPGEASVSTNRSLESDPPQARAELDKKLDYLGQLPPDQRRQMYARFQQFFELTDREKQKTLGVLSEAERQQMAGAVQTFARLPKAQRDLCLESFGKFAGMTDEERRQFFRNAERWREMSPAERQTWRNLVAHLPPLPPGVGMPRPPALPAPPAPRAELRMATNEAGR